MDRIDWNRLLCLLVFGSLLALACWTGEARVIVGSIVVLAWPFAFVYFGDELGSTLGLHFGLVNRVSEGTLVKIGGWILLAIYLTALSTASAGEQDRRRPRVRPAAAATR